MRSFFALLLSVFVVAAAFPQSTFPTNGAPFNPNSVYAFINANIQKDPETLIKGGMMVVQKGRIISVSERAEPPKDAVVYDLKGKYIYPSFIDLFSDYGLNQPPPQKRTNRGAPQIESSVKGAYAWNQALKADYRSYEHLVHNNEKALELKRMGFGIVLSSVKDGIVRGSGVLLSLNSNKRENESVILEEAAAFYSFIKGTSTQDYPTSLTGAIALLRQTYYDAKWYAQKPDGAEYNITLQELNRLQKFPSVFDAGDKFNALRAAKVGSEFGINYIIKGSGNEYQRADDIAGSKLKYILPLNFPPAYDVEEIYDANAISLSEMKHWELAPANPAILDKKGLNFSFTSNGLKNTSEFLANLRKAVKYGLSEGAALAALTTNPASFIKADDRIGVLKKGFHAHFFISSRSIFDDDAVILQHWTGGEPSVFSEIEQNDIRGVYNLSMEGSAYEVNITGTEYKTSAKIKIDTLNREFHFTFKNNLLTFYFLRDSGKVVRGSGNYAAGGRSFTGNGQLANGKWFDWQMNFIKEVPDTAKPRKTEPVDDLGKVIYPFTAFGEPLPESQGPFKESWNKFKNRYSAILIKNATVWTNEEAGVLTDHDVYIVEGRIVRIAPNIDVPKLAFPKVIDAKGRHLTAGIIDEHSHIALTAGVNEAGQASSAEVRMADVINPDDINIYRQLSGGVTTAQLLHGSANPIGGQSALIKLRWGHNAEAMLYEGADPFIKFALGENVKQSNWGDLQSVRFPQSRMGVEQVFNDHFSRAQEYTRKKSSVAKNSVFRTDLELEALSEILAKKRFITCHSYVQSEINMLMHIADSFGFKVNTFTHILEGYKVADKMKNHGAYASTFSDWWAYKNEVMEAIPQNAALMTKAGLVTAINSDDAEMARRLNQEAAKCVKYGGLTEEEALRLVTLNPAKMLHIDNKVGSIKVSKVADVVLWSDHPLSVYARADYTIIDGQIYFDREEDARLRQYVDDERSRLIAKLLAEKQKGARVEKAVKKEPKLYHCNTIEGIDESLTGQR